MNDNPIQPEAWNAAGRTAALLLSIVCFAAIWEADSDRSQPDQFASENGAPPALSPSESATPIDIGSRKAKDASHHTTVQLDRTVQRNGGLVRIRLELQPLDQNDAVGRTELSEIVCEGKVDDLRRELLALLKQLDQAPEIVPASASTESKPEIAHRGFLFLSRRSADETGPQAPVSIDSSEGPSIKTQRVQQKPGLLDSSVRTRTR